MNILGYHSYLLQYMKQIQDMRRIRTVLGHPGINSATSIADKYILNGDRVTTL